MFCLMLYIKGYLYVYREKTIKLLFLEIARIIFLYNPIDRHTVNVLKFPTLTISLLNENDDFQGGKSQ